MLTDIEGEEATKQTLTEQRDAIETLAKKDYDPLFGEPYEPFVTVYMQAMESLSKLFKPTEKNTMDCAKKWAEQLDVMLDIIVSARRLHSGFDMR